MYDAYHRIFERCGLTFRAVEADAGAIGGEGGTHEFMALADIGEDTIAVCSHCEYAANVEKATSTEDRIEDGRIIIPMYEQIHTPGVRTIEQLTRYLIIKPVDVMKTLIYLADGNPVAVLVRGDHEVNEIKVKNALGVDTLALADAETTESVTSAEVGFAGPIGLSIPLLVDEAVARMNGGIAGANKNEYHVKNVVPGRDFPVVYDGDYRNVKEDESCSHCEEGKLRFAKGIEVGHVFQVHLIPVSIKDETQRNVAENLYDTLRQRGIDVLFDDRDERAGVKFNDSDLIGIPIRIVIGKDAIYGNVEYVERWMNDKQLLSIDEALIRICCTDLSAC